MAQLRSQTVHASRQVDTDEAVPLLIQDILRDANQLLVANNSCDISRAIQTPKLLDHGGDPVVHLLALRDVHLGGHEGGILLLEELPGLLECDFVIVRNADNAAALNNELGRGEANATGAASDGNDLILERHHNNN